MFSGAQVLAVLDDFAERRFTKRLVLDMFVSGSAPLGGSRAADEEPPMQHSGCVRATAG